MIRTLMKLGLAAVLAGAAGAAAPATTGETLSAGAIKDAVVYRPKATPDALVLFLSGDGGWNLGVVSMARSLTAEGAAVAGISTPALLKALEAGSAGPCEDLDGALADFADTARAKLGVPAGAPLLVVGYSSGATLVYLAQAGAARAPVKGGVALGFCPDLMTKKPICLDASLNPARHASLGFIYPARTAGLAGFTALQGMQDKVCDPAATIAFVGSMPGAKVVELPKVGHGFGVEKNWMPQYLAAYRDISGGARP